MTRRGFSLAVLAAVLILGPGLSLVFHRASAAPLAREPLASLAPTSLAVVKTPPRPPARDTTRRRVTRVALTDTAMVDLHAGSRTVQAFVAFPPGQASGPGVVIAHEWWGLNPQIRELAKRLARQGYVAIVPDLYHGHVATDADMAHVLSRSLDQDEALADLSAASSWLAGEERSNKRRRGVMGFCMGGGLALEAALHDPSLVAIVMFYGTPELRPERLAALHGPLLGHFGAEDQGIDTVRVDAFRRALAGARKSAEIHVYAGAGHAFMNEERESYRPEAANLAWVRTLDFLQKNLKSTP